MNIVFINESDIKGGAAIAVNRLYQAFKNINDINIEFLVQNKFSNENKIQALASTRISKLLVFLRFIIERLFFIPNEKSKDIRFQFSLANTGLDISGHPLIKNADIIQLNWFNHGFLSLQSIRKLLALNKPIILILHDMWAFTGGCHYSIECTNYKIECKYCPYLKRPGSKDLSNRIFNKKLKIYKNSNLNIVGISKWMARSAKTSKLLGNFPIFNIPNTIDTEIFIPKDKTTSRKKLNLPNDKKLVLFGAANTLEKRKGIKYLQKAISLIKNKYPTHAQQVQCIIFGKIKTPITFELPSISLTYISSNETLTDLYSAADVFVLPSIQDNFPNTILESMSCGTPVVAFSSSGLPEMIDHLKTGYLAELKNENDLVKGIIYVIENSLIHKMPENSRKKVIDLYSNNVITNEYIKLYNKILNK